MKKKNPYVTDGMTSLLLLKRFYDLKKRQKKLNIKASIMFFTASFIKITQEFNGYFRKILRVEQLFLRQKSIGTIFINLRNLFLISWFLISLYIAIN